MRNSVRHTSPITFSVSVSIAIAVAFSVAFSFSLSLSIAISAVPIVSAAVSVISLPIISAFIALTVRAIILRCIIHSCLSCRWVGRGRPAKRNIVRRSSRSHEARAQSQSENWSSIRPITPRRRQKTPQSSGPAQNLKKKKNMQVWERYKIVSTTPRLGIRRMRFSSILCTALFGSLFALLAASRVLLTLIFCVLDWCFRRLTACSVCQSSSSRYNMQNMKLALPSASGRASEVPAGTTGNGG